MCEMSARIWSRYYFRDSAVTDWLLFIDCRKASSLFLNRCNCPDPLKLIWASFDVLLLSSTSAWKKSDSIRRTVSFCTFVTIESEEKESSVRVPFGEAWKLIKFEKTNLDKLVVVLLVTLPHFNWVDIILDIFEVVDVSLKLKLTNFEIFWVGQVNHLVEWIFGEDSNDQRVYGSVFADYLVVDELFVCFPNGKTVVQVFGHYLFDLCCCFLVDPVLHLREHLMFGHRTSDLTEEIPFGDNSWLIRLLVSVGWSDCKWHF